MEKIRSILQRLREKMRGWKSEIVPATLCLLLSLLIWAIIGVAEG